MIGEHRHSIRLQASLNETFEACRDVTAWPSFMPAVRQALFIEQGELADVIAIVAEANEQLWHWQSRRRLNRQAGTIVFERLEPIHPLIEMRGQWTVKPIDTIVEVELHHRFEIADGFSEMEEFLSKAIRSNATRDLDALRRYLEEK